ncbi:MAG: GNAT family N-acetyltransferase [Pseudomonadota bacterium]
MIEIFEALDQTWPPADLIQENGFVFRSGRGGGKRVSATKIIGDLDPNQLSFAENKMSDMGQDKLFSLRADDVDSVSILEENGYEIIDPTVLLSAPVGHLTRHPVPPVLAFPIWGPLQIQRDIWMDGEIGPARIAVMDRVAGGKTAILGRIQNRAAGTVFVAIAGDIAMAHALYVLPDFQRYGLGRHLMHAAAHWAETAGAKYLAVAVTRANAKALALYSALGMREIAGYYYLRKH